ncbi:MAG TPA: S53 family peptidase [Terriglobia bacterium]|nr:S53 family peptidase [Terriglobia bacterium]
MRRSTICLAPGVLCPRQHEQEIVYGMEKNSYHVRAHRVISLLIVFLFSTCLAVAQQANLETQPPILVHGNAQAGIVGTVPSQILHAYGFDQVTNQGAGQTIGIVDAYKNPRIENDLAVFSQAFGLPACSSANGCFKTIQVGGHDPGTKTLWALEEALDVEWVHAIAPRANILLVEAQSAKLSDMLQGVDVAVQNGATVVSMSWGTPEFSTESNFDSHFIAPHVTFVAASGDFGNPGFYPAASPIVIGVGGTTLSADALGNYNGETAWSGSGGGISPYELQPGFQNVKSSGMRGIPDVAYNADPNTGFAVYTSTPYQGFGGWVQVGGTSAAAPQWAALIAIANAMNNGPSLGTIDVLYKLYGATPAFHDITSGTNGTCGSICTAGAGYDFVTGLGSPIVPGIVNALH